MLELAAAPLSGAADFARMARRAVASCGMRSRQKDSFPAIKARGSYLDLVKRTNYFSWIDN